MLGSGTLIVKAPLPSRATIRPMEGVSADPKLELLKRVPLFAGLDSDALIAVAAITESATYRPARR